MWGQIVWKEVISRSSNSQCSHSKINLSAQLVRACPSPPILYEKDTPSHPEFHYFALPGDPPKQGNWKYWQWCQENEPALAASNK